MAIKPIPLLEMFKWWKNMHEWNTIDIAVSLNNPLYSLPSIQQIFIGHLLSARRCSQHCTGKGTLSSLQPHHVGGPIMMPVLELSKLRPREVARVTQQEKGRTGFLNRGSLVPDQCSGSCYKTAVTKTDWNACPHGADSSAGSEQAKENTKHGGWWFLSFCVYLLLSTIVFRPLSFNSSPAPCPCWGLMALRVLLQLWLEPTFLRGSGSFLIPCHCEHLQVPRSREKMDTLRVRDRWQPTQVWVLVEKLSPLSFICLST